jgi:hypothetical protein
VYGIRAVCDRVFHSSSISCHLSSTVESFENATVFGSVIVPFAVSAGVFFIVVATLVSAVVSASMITS